jgi:hypothetical protein
MREFMLAVTTALTATALSSAQERPTFAFEGAAAYVWVRSDTAALIGAGAVRRRGPVFAGEGRVTLRGVTLAASLLEGQLQSVSTSSPRDLVEARVAIAGRPLPWLELAAGPVVRAYVADSVTERWVFWQARARVDAPIVATRLTSYVELWRALSSQLNLATPAGRVQGGEAGVMYQLPGSPVWMRLGYRIDDAALGAVGSETLEAITFAVGTGTR